MSQILVVDNYDSFVYTIVDYLQQLGAQTTVLRNDVVDPTTVSSYDGVLVSPGPGAPAEAGQSMNVIRECARTRTPMFGVCLGHQALGEVFGATVSHAPELRHGKTSEITHEQTAMMAGLQSPLRVTRYHSLAIEPETMPQDLRTVAQTSTGIIMAIEHTSLPLWGVQFHPESVLTEGGHTMFANWLITTGVIDALELAQGKAPLVRKDV